MYGKSALLGLAILCIAGLLFLVLSRDRLCSLHLKSGSTELTAQLAYEVR